MRALLVDDEPLLVVSVLRALRVERPAWTIETAGNGLEAMRILKSKQIDILITDIQMPGMDGMALLRQIRMDPEFVRLPLILISALTDRSSVRTGMASGADDYLTKPFTVAELILAVEGRLRRQQQAADSPALAEQLRERLKETLTDREREVLALIGQGLVSKDIAAELQLSPRTIGVHRQNIMRKLDLHNAAALAALAIRANLTCPTGGRVNNGLT
jgi:DNA-binding NarL/FixJ family response regulator